MKFGRKKRAETATWVLVAGVVVTGAVAAYAISRLWRSQPVTTRRERRALEKRIVQALLVDPNTQSLSIDVAGVGSGVVELSGNVETDQDARRVVDRVNTVPGVHAVVNRLEIRTLETKLSRNRQKQSGDGTRWYGGSVGIGKRRQSYMTDPPRRDDHADLLSRALQPNRDDTLTEVEESEGTGVRIGLSNASALTTDVAPPSPNRAVDEPEPPPAIAPHDRAQRE